MRLSFKRITSARDFLFIVQKPETTLRDVAESAVREIVGRSEVGPLLKQARQASEDAVRKLMQRVLDGYAAGVRGDQACLQRLPARRGDRRIPRRAGSAEDAEKLQNDAQAYRNKAIPEARGEAECILQSARAYRERTIAEAAGGGAPCRS